MFRKLVYLSGLILIVTTVVSCKHKKEPTQYIDETAFAGVGGESIDVDGPIVFDDPNDAANEEDQRTPPSSVDNNFDDFLYVFNVNRRFFVDRVTFPFILERRGSRILINDYQEVRSLYRETIQDAYTILYTDKESYEQIDRNELTCASVVSISLDTKTVKSFHFALENNKWFMKDCIETLSSEYVLNDFIEFYSKFCVDASFRKSHLSDEISIVIHTENGDMEGNITPDQYDSFVSSIPQGIIVNIELGQELSSIASHVYMRQCNLSMGDEQRFGFERRNNDWYLVEVL